MLESPFFSERLPVQLDYFGMFYPSNSIYILNHMLKTQQKHIQLWVHPSTIPSKCGLYQMELGLITGELGLWPLGSGVTTPLITIRVPLYCIYIYIYFFVCLFCWWFLFQDSIPWVDSSFLGHFFQPPSRTANLSHQAAAAAGDVSCWIGTLMFGRWFLLGGSSQDL